MFGKDFRRQRAGQPIAARSTNQFIGPVSGLMRFRVGPGLAMKWLNGTPIPWAPPSPVFKWFYTTSTITSATASATGTAIGSATMSDGTGTARRCKETGTGTGETRVPDTAAADETIYCPVITATAVATGSFVRCAWINGRWELDMTVRCPGT